MKNISNQITGTKKINPKQKYTKHEEYLHTTIAKRLLDPIEIHYYWSFKPKQISTPIPSRIPNQVGNKICILLIDFGFYIPTLKDSNQRNKILFSSKSNKEWNSLIQSICLQIIHGRIGSHLYLYITKS